MAKKQNASVKKTKKSAASATKTSAKAAPKPKAAKRAAPRAAAKAGGNSRATPPSFDEAKSAAIDALIQGIEDAERRLSAVKKVESFAELHKLIGKRAI